MMQCVPKCAEPGNTITGSRKRVNAAKRWCFTYNNHTDFGYEMICAKIKQFCRFAIIGEEIAPTSGTRHLQGYIEFREKRRPIGTFGMTELHWELARGSKADNILYCSKEKEIFRFPKPFKQEIQCLYDWQQRIVDLLKTKPDDRTINWYWEDKGGLGKTTFQKYIFGAFQKVVVLSGKGSDMKNGVMKYYEATQSLPKIVLINIPRCNQRFVSWSGLEEIKDMFFYSPKYEGGMVCGECPHVICFANAPPDESLMSRDRWNIENLY
ncbi:MAG: putative viral replication protein [Circoviridae sp.]|nr:MAG: putative viral replication protein [Circoviridae sp.]